MFKCTFLDEKRYIMIQSSRRKFVQGSIWTYAILGSGHGLVVIRHQAIIWTNDD